ncbi:MAG: antitoxin family protein [Pyrinomonadaceae bacterium]
MSKTLHAIYDGEVLRPEEEPDLQPNTRYRVTVEEEERSTDKADDAAYPLTVLLGLATDMGVTDLSFRHDHYAHTPLEDHDNNAG